jgi:hypothetical protein
MAAVTAALASMDPQKLADVIAQVQLLRRGSIQPKARSG